MSTPPIPLDEIRELILAAIREFDWQRARPVLAELVGNTPAYMERHFALEHCVSPTTLILTADLRWELAKNLRAGDEVIAFSDATEARWTLAKVTGNSLGEMPAFKVTLSSGDRLFVTGEHRWRAPRRLSGGRSGGQRWVHTRDLRPRDRGHDQPSQVLRLLKVWDEYDPGFVQGYLSGVFDGEGWLTVGERGGSVGFGQKEGAVLTKTKEGLAQLGFEPLEYNGQRAQQLHIGGGIPEVMRFLGLVRPERLLSKFRTTEYPHGRRVHPIESEVVESVEPLGLREMSVLSTSTGTFIANGYGAHNTIPSPSSVLTCRRQLWYKSHGIETGHTLPESWAMRAAAGMVMEPWWFMILGLADPRLKVTSRDEVLDITPDVGGTCDGYLDEIGALLELKSQTGWKFIFNTDKGIESESPEHIAQCQLYMHGTKREWCLYVASAADPQLVRWVKNRKKDPAFEYPFFLLEWVQYDPERAGELVERLGMILEDKETENPAPREHNPQTTKWPCLLGCRWRDACLQVEGS